MYGVNAHCTHRSFTAPGFATVAEANEYAETIPDLEWYEITRFEPMTEVDWDALPDESSYL